MKTNNVIGAVCASVLFFSSIPVVNAIGTSAADPGYSIADILMQGGGFSDGVYWIDPDLPGGDSPFQVFGDMTTDGGGWTLAMDKSGLPDLSSQSNALQILAVDQTASIRFITATFDAFYSGNALSNLPTSGWTILFGNPSSLYGQTWSNALSVADSVYVRESNTVAYPSAVPVPAAVWLFGSGLLGLVGVARRKNNH